MSVDLTLTNNMVLVRLVISFLLCLPYFGIYLTKEIQIIGGKDAIDNVRDSLKIHTVRVEGISKKVIKFHKGRSCCKYFKRTKSSFYIL